MVETITVPEHFTAGFKQWLARFGLNAIELVGTAPTLYKLVPFGGDEGGGREVRAGDTMSWDTRTDRLSLHPAQNDIHGRPRPAGGERDRPPLTTEGRVMALAREGGFLHELLEGLAEGPLPPLASIPDIGPWDQLPLVRRAARVINDLQARGQIEVRDAPDRDWDAGRPLSGKDLDAALADPGALTGTRTIMLRLAAEAPGPD